MCGTKLKVPKEMRTFCPKCRKHVSHSVSIYKKGRENRLSQGVRRHELEKHGYGGQKWPELKRTAKTTKKQVLKLKCKTCGNNVFRLGKRLRKLTVGA